MSKSEKSEKKEKNIKPERGVETMLRIMTGTHQRMAQMADGKAHILITVNSIILSVIISLVFRRLESSAFLIIPTLILLLISLLTIVFSIIATRPSFSEGQKATDNIENENINLLFFESFNKISLEEYLESMNKMILDIDLLHSTLISNIYFQGVFLNSKYKTLRQAYNIFMYGLIVSVCAFVIAIAIHENASAKPL